MGTRFIATHEANAVEDYKQLILSSEASDIIYTNLFTGVHGNCLRGSIVKASLDPDDLPTSDKSAMRFGSGSSSASKAWRDIWGAGQGVGNIDAVTSVTSVAEVVAGLRREYAAVRERLAEVARYAEPAARAEAMD
ncbi:hypothetical protein HOP52_04180 [Halomonas campisalis]|uniref:Nitronate monooxygenase domain-containing protein n=2 Tax=Billgrantia campisalis TaxID=74661 RepID=A0ABS9P5B6_9GAMM|nr:hypothetical protein [Halomonas campisalis]